MYIKRASRSKALRMREYGVLMCACGRGCSFCIAAHRGCCRLRCCRRRHRNVFGHRRKCAQKRELKRLIPWILCVCGTSRGTTYTCTYVEYAYKEIRTMWRCFGGGGRSSQPPTSACICVFVRCVGSNTWCCLDGGWALCLCCCMCRSIALGKRDMVPLYSSIMQLRQRRGIVVVRVLRKRFVRLCVAITTEEGDVGSWRVVLYETYADASQTSKRIMSSSPEATHASPWPWGWGHRAVL